LNNPGHGPTLARKILLSISSASIGFLTVLSILVHYANEKLEYDLLERQIADELTTLSARLAQNPHAKLPQSAYLSVYLHSRHAPAELPSSLSSLPSGVHHDISIGGRDYHVVISEDNDDVIYLQYDITEIEQSENLLTTILLMSWVVMITLVLILARGLSRSLADPVARLSQEVSQLNPSQRGVQLSQQFSDDEVGRIAAAFDLYLRRMDEYVEKQNAFTAMASHELRSPMTIVQTSADLIDYQHNDTATAQQVAKIRRATRGMSDMIDALLQITRDQGSAQDITTIELRALVDEVVEWLQSDLRLKQIKVINAVDATTTIDANRTLVMVVCTNLVKNAIRHGTENDIRIEWTAPTLSIINDGFDIEPEEFEHLFDFAFRGQGSQGYGIGLYVSKLICDHQSWALELTPIPGGGTRASVSFN